ncbi:excalibur calcium-binding domain-containing protein [Arthrobacter sp. B3I9]|uniref:excalibur calcium-binding domain-containing protein n=1 Tax=Arthrobacter sp. B3I9 TaxID=3042270 RepID=UPI0027D91AE6|nr:excalibur calcium-binding domain-containing protein [Arthrobacter sp. B3I9]
MLLLVILFAASAGFAGVLIILGIVALFTGLYALVFKRRSWVGLPHRKSAGVVAAAGVVVCMVGGGVAGATATPAPVADKSALVASPKPSPSGTPSATPTATSPANSPCTTSGESQKYNDKLFICTMDSSERLVWLNETESKKVVAQKAAADKAAADKVAGDKVAADKLAADKAAADKAVADKVAADKLAAEQAAAAAAAKAAPAPFVAPAPAPYVAPAPAPAPAPYVPPAPAAAYYANCSAVRAAGAAPIRAGQPGYSRSLDRDGDGVACE